MIKVYFCDFWPGFNPYQNLLKDLIRLALRADIHICHQFEASDADIILCSVFGTEKARHSRIPRLVYIGENIRPDYLQYEYSLSFDVDNYGGKNVRLPLWLWSFDWFENNPNAHSRRSYELLVEGYVPSSFMARQRKCVALIGNPTRWRLEHLRKINKSLTIEAFGNAFSRPLAGGHRDKLLLLTNYQYHYCCENSIFPGYITEKIIDAKLAGCIPLYHSGNNVDNELNLKSIFDLASIDSEQFPCEEPILWADPLIQASEPLFNSPFSIETLVATTAELLASALSVKPY